MTKSEETKMEVDSRESIVPFKSLSILKLTKDSQQQHGLRHGNYKRYGDYCDRRIRRLRKALKFTHQYKCVPNHKAKFLLRPIADENVVDVRFLELAVFDVEHCWARGMEFKVASENEKDARQIHHARRRLRKAVKYAQTLAAMVKESPRVTDFTKTETTAYTASINGAEAVEQRKWANALEQFINARAVYQKLAKSIKDEELGFLYDQKVKELSNIIKLCEYNAGKKGVVAPDISQLDLNESMEAVNVKEEEKSDKQIKKEQKEAKKIKKEQQPLPKPVSAKPTFFDLALKHFTIPQEFVEIAESKPEPSQDQQAQAGGLGGMVRNLFWGSKQ